jgi:hypothetical protein
LRSGERFDPSMLEVAEEPGAAGDAIGEEEPQPDL